MANDSNNNELNLIQLKNEEGKNIYPISSTEAILDPSGNSLEEFVRNISSEGGDGKYVKYDENQHLRETDKEIARSNIDSAKAQDVLGLAYSTIGMFVCTTSTGASIKEIQTPPYVNSDGETQDINILTGAEFKIRFIEPNTARNVDLMINGDASTRHPLYWNGLRVDTENTWTAGQIADIWFDGSIYYAKPHLVINSGGGGGGGSHDDVFHVDCGPWVDGSESDFVSVGIISKYSGIENRYYTYLTNTMDSIALKPDGTVDGEQMVSTVVYAYNGIVPSSAITRITVYDTIESDNTVYADIFINKSGVTENRIRCRDCGYDGPSGGLRVCPNCGSSRIEIFRGDTILRNGITVTVTKRDSDASGHTFDVSVSFGDGANMSESNKRIFLIRCVINGENQYTNFNVNLVRGTLANTQTGELEPATLWKLNLNMEGQKYGDPIIIKDGSSVTPSRDTVITASVVKMEGSEQTINPVSGYTLQRSVNGDSWKTIVPEEAGVAVSSLTVGAYSGLRYRLTDSANCTVGHGIYLCADFNDKTQRWETHDVWHKGSKWRCLVHQPVDSGGVQFFNEPKWNSPYWQLLEGSDAYSMEFSSTHGYSFRYAHVYTVVTPYLYCGYEDISLQVPEEQWNWTRCMLKNGVYIDQGNEKWNNEHTRQRNLTITNEDVPVDWDSYTRVVFTCKVHVFDGKNLVYFENQVII